jgi:hypothetical protein
MATYLINCDITLYPQLFECSRVGWYPVSVFGCTIKSLILINLLVKQCRIITVLNISHQKHICFTVCFSEFLRAKMPPAVLMCTGVACGTLKLASMKRALPDCIVWLVYPQVAQRVL